MSSKLKLIRQSVSEKERAFQFQKELNEEKKKNQMLQLQIKQLQLENEDLQKKIISEVPQLEQIILENGPDGYNALEWQKLVKNCIEKTAVKLSDLQTKMTQVNQN